jgi:AI-2 transport protein TqsA
VTASEGPAPGPRPDSQPGLLPRGVVVLLAAAGTVVAVAGIRELAGLLGPVFLALMLVVAARPAQSWMLRHGLPRWLSTVAVLVILYSVLIALVTLLVVSLAQLATLLPTYSGQANAMLATLQRQLLHYGVGTGQINDIVRQVDIGRVTTVVTVVLSQLSSLTTSLFFLLAVMFFMGLDAAGFPDRLAQLRTVRPAVADALASFASGTRRYLVVSSLFGLVCAVLDVGALYWLGVPLPILWGVLAFITNYIPNIGFAIGLVPPTLLGLLVGGVRTMLLVVLAYVAVNVVIQTVIQPKYVGDVVGLSPTVTFLATAFWAWALGPLGALLAIPLTLLAKALLVDADPAARWLDLLVGAGARAEPFDHDSAISVASDPPAA